MRLQDGRTGVQDAGGSVVQAVLEGQSTGRSHGLLCAWVPSFDYTAGKSGKKGRPALQFLLLFAVFLMKYLCSGHSELINSNSDVNISQH